MFKQTKRALLLAVFTLIVCLGMLLGTTYAWFTDSVSSGSNVIQTGNLDVVLQHKSNWSNEWATVNEDTKIFKEDAKYEPGYTEIVYLRVSNAGSLALNYILSLNLGNEVESVNVNGEPFKISDYLQIGWYVQDEFSSGFNYANILIPSMFGTREAALKKVELQKLSEAKATIAKAPILPGNDTAQVIVIVLTMPESVGNEANTKTGEKVPSIELGVRLFATQQVHESDSFGTDYDSECAAYTVAEANQKLAANEDVTLVNCVEPNSIIYVPANYTGKLTLSNVAVASIQESNAPVTVSAQANNAVAKIEILGEVKVKATAEGMSAITGKNINIIGTGTLTAIGKGEAGFGIGGIDTESINISDVKIAYVEGGCAGQEGADTKYYKDAPGGGAAIGSGFNGATITLNNVTVKKAIGGSKAAAIGARFWTGVTVNINDSEILYAEGGVTAAAIGGSRVSSAGTEKGTTININNSTVNAVGGVYGAGIGSGYDTHCSSKQPMCTINIKDSNITAQGGKYAAGVGTGYHMAALSGEISNSEVNAKPGEEYYKNTYTLAMGVGFGVVDPAREGTQTESNINYNGNKVSLENAYFGIKTIDDLKTALTKNGRYQLVADIEVAKNETLTIANGVEAVLNLNGKTIKSTADKTGNQELFLVKGNLTVENGNLEYTALNNQGWGAMITIFDVTAGGELTLEEVTATVSGSDMNFIVHLNNWGEVTLNVNKCDFTASYVAIRAFNSGYDMNNVKVENTAFHQGRVFWVHNYTSEGKDDSTLNLNIYGNNNTTDNAKPVRFGFSNEVYYDINGNEIK